MQHGAAWPSPARAAIAAGCSPKRGVASPATPPQGHEIAVLQGHKGDSNGHACRHAAYGCPQCIGRSAPWRIKSPTQLRFVTRKCGSKMFESRVTFAENGSGSTARRRSAGLSGEERSGPGRGVAAGVFSNGTPRTRSSRRR